MRRVLLVSVIAMVTMAVTAAVAYAHHITNLQLSCAQGLSFDYGSFSETATITWSGGLVQQVPLSGDGTYKEAIPASAESDAAPTTVDVKWPEGDLKASTSSACLTPPPPPPPPTCPSGTTGTYPNCVTPPVVVTPPPAPPVVTPSPAPPTPTPVVPTPKPKPKPKPPTPRPQPAPLPCVTHVTLSTHVLNLDPPGLVRDMHLTRLNVGRCHSAQQDALRRVKLTHNPQIAPANGDGTISFHVHASGRVRVLSVRWYVQGQYRGTTNGTITFHSKDFTRTGTEIYGIKDVVAVVKVKVSPDVLGNY